MIISDSRILNFVKQTGAHCVEVLDDDKGYLLWLCDRVWISHNHPELWASLSQNDDLIISKAMALIKRHWERTA